METLIPVIVGGIIGVLGGIAGPPISHWLNEGAAKKKKQAEKLEELIGVVYAYDHWLDVVRCIRVYGEAGAEPASPLASAQAISAVYFPEVGAVLEELETAGRQFERWMLDRGQQRVVGNLTELGTGLEEAFWPYRVKFNAVIEMLKKLARTKYAVK